MLSQIGRRCHLRHLVDLMPLDTVPFIHSALFVARIDDLRHWQNAAYTRQDIDAVFARAVNVVQLSNQVELESLLANSLAPDLRVLSILSSHIAGDALPSQSLADGR